MKALFLLGLTFIFFSGCRKIDEYPLVPVLTYKSVDFTVDSLGSLFTLKATFTDGDGDIGYRSEVPNGDEFDDPTSPYYYNFHIILQVLQNNVWKDSTEFILNSRLPYLTPQGKNKALKGEITKTDFLPFLSDTIRFTSFIYDRSKNKSNLIETPAYIIDVR